MSFLHCSFVGESFEFFYSICDLKFLCRECVREPNPRLTAGSYAKRPNKPSDPFSLAVVFDICYLKFIEYFLRLCSQITDFLKTAPALRHMHICLIKIGSFYELRQHSIDNHF